MFALDGCKNLRSGPRHDKLSQAGIATVAPIRITTVRALVTIPIVVRATDKGEIAQANLRASTSAQREEIRRNRAIETCIELETTTDEQ